MAEVYRERFESATQIDKWLADQRQEFDGETRITKDNQAWFTEESAPSLRDYRDKAKRTPDSLPARFYRMMMGEEWDGEGHSYSIATKRYRRLATDSVWVEKERERQQRKKRDYSKKKRPADDNARRQARRKAQREREKATMVASTPRLASAHGQEGSGGGSPTEGGLPLHASAHGQEGGGGGSPTEGGQQLHASTHGQEGGGHGQEGGGGGSLTEGGLSARP